MVGYPLSPTKNVPKLLMLLAFPLFRGEASEGGCAPDCAPPRAGASRNDHDIHPARIPIENQFKHARNLGTSDLEATGKQAYEEKLAGIQTTERLDPANIDTVLRPIWLAIHDLVQLVIENGGAPVEADPVMENLRGGIWLRRGPPRQPFQRCKSHGERRRHLERTSNRSSDQGSWHRREREKQASDAAG